MVLTELSQTVAYHVAWETFGFKLPANPVREGKICMTVVVNINPSPTGLAGNLNPRSCRYANFKQSVHGT